MAATTTRPPQSRAKIFGVNLGAMAARAPLPYGPSLSAMPIPTVVWFQL